MTEAFCQWLLGGCAIAIVGLSGTCVKLFRMYQAELLARIVRAERVAAILEGLYETKHEDG